MTKRILIVIIFVLSIIIAAEANNQSANRKPQIVPIIKANEKGMFDSQISGANDPGMFKEVIDGDGVYYGKCMVIILKSKIDSLILLKLDCGTLLIPTNNSAQKNTINNPSLCR